MRTIRSAPLARKNPVQQRRVDLRVENEVLPIATPGQDIPGKRLFEPKFLARIDSPLLQWQRDGPAVYTVRVEVDGRDHDIVPVRRHLRVSQDVRVGAVE